MLTGANPRSAPLIKVPQARGPGAQNFLDLGQQHQYASGAHEAIS
jgi:hypothetical protein